MLALMDESPLPGFSEEFLDKENLWRPQGLGSAKILDQCPIKPSIIGRIAKFSPFSQNEDLCSLFLEYVEEAGISAPLEWHHSALNFKAYQLGLSHFCRQMPVLNAEQMKDLAIAEVWMKRHFSPIMCDSKVLGSDIALSRMDLSTSPGPLWRRKGQTKREALEFLTQEGAINRYWEELGAPACPRTFWSANLKDELRPAEKVALNKTRIFLIAPVEHCQAMVRLFGDQNEKLIISGRNGTSANCVGVEFFRKFFDRLHRVFDDYEENEFGDIKKYDTSIFEALLLGVAQFRFECLSDGDRTPENWCRTANLYRDVIRTAIVLQNGLIILKTHGNPSGQMNTSTDDTLILYWVLCFCWLRAGGPNDFATFKQACRFFLYGDDSIVLKRGTACEFLSRENIRKGLAELGMEVEFSDRAEFLGHQMCWSEYLNIYVPVLATERIYASLAQGGKNDPHLVFVRACNLRVASYTNPGGYRLADGFAVWMMRTFPWLDRSPYVPEALLKSIHLDTEDAPCLFEQDVTTTISARAALTAQQTNTISPFVQKDCSRPIHDGIQTSPCPEGRAATTAACSGDS